MHETKVTRYNLTYKVYLKVSKSNGICNVLVNLYF
jgi:hypothetical protein